MTDARTRILVVDDDDGGRYLKAHILRKSGYAVVEAASGAAALEQCRDAEPDLVLLDVVLPDVSGVEICRQIKAAHAGVPVLQTSAAITTAHDRALSLVGGADAFLIEPIEPEELVATAKALLRMRAAEQALRRMNENLENAVAERTRELTDAYQRLEVEAAERRKAEEVLWHAQKLDAVGQLTGGIAHDFNNLLAVIVASLEMIHAALGNPQALGTPQAVVTPQAPGHPQALGNPQARGNPQEVMRSKMLRLVKTAQAATDRGAKLTRQLLAFARRSTLRPEVITIDEAIVACEPFLRRALGEAVTFRITFEPGLWPCRIDPVQFEAALLNLVVNARDAMPGGGDLEIATSNVTVGDAAPHRTTGLDAGDYVRLRLTDTGTGMDPDVATRAFEPFFTTKDVGKGTGLGLSQVYGFVKQSGGHVTIDTKPGCGTSFLIYLPRCEAVGCVSETYAGDMEIAPTGTETVLVVEDNADVRELARATISGLGYRVLEASSGPAALDLLKRDDGIDLLFSDVVLPLGMNGFELVHKARAMRSGLRALMTSGYANIQRPGTERPDVPLLLKPYRRDELAQRIRLALDRA
jgi:signal transduction histidine kinase